MQTTKQSRQQFYIAMDMGCGRATAYGACGFMMAVSRLDKPVTLKNGQVMRYAVAGFTCHWLTPSARGALAIVARCFNTEPPLWRPFIASNAPEPRQSAEPIKQYLFQDGTQAQRVARAIRASDRQSAQTWDRDDSWTITRQSARRYLIVRSALTMGGREILEMTTVSIPAALKLIATIYDTERYDAIWQAV